MNGEKGDLTSVVVVEKPKGTNIIRKEPLARDVGEGDPEKVPCLSKNSRLNIFEDFVRFDLSRSGIFCCLKYTISVQYDDDFLLGKSSTVCCSSFFHSQKSIEIGKTNRDGVWTSLFQIKFPSYANCLFKPKKRTFLVQFSDSDDQIGAIDVNSFEKTTIINNFFEKSFYRKGKIRDNQFLITDELNGKVGTIEISRGLRGGITSYGLSILDDGVSGTTKALMISTVLAMDIEDRESEAKCSMLWTPLISSIVIILFTLVPWWYFQQRNHTS